MKLRTLLSTASLACLALAVAAASANAQTQLPSIEVGKNKPTKHAGKSQVASRGKATGKPSHPSAGRGGGSGSVAGVGSGLGSGGGDGSGAGSGGAGAGTGARGYGGAGPAQDPFNKTYVLQNASTGTKTDTPVMDTPLNVQSVTQQVLKDQQDITLAEALRNVSSVAVLDTNSSGNVARTGGISLRGFKSSTYYRDGFRIDGSLTNSDLVGSGQLGNVASVEVLKGPGAILYGLVEPGGIVNLTTKEPLNAPYYSVNQQIGSLGVYRTSVDATGPVNADKSVLYRMNMSYENNGAPYGSEIDLTHSQNLFLAPVVKWNIDPTTWVKLEAQYAEDRLSIYSPVTPLLNGAIVTIPRSRNYGEYSPQRLNNYFSALTWSHQFDNDWSVKQQISYASTNEHELQIIPRAFTITDGLTATREPSLQEFGSTTLSTNVDITGHINTFGAEHTLLLGGDVYRLASDNNFQYSGGASNISLWDPVHGFPTPWIPLYPYVNHLTQNTAGLYLQDQIKLPYDFFLLAGARYQYIRQTSASGSAPYTVQWDALPLTGQALTPRFGLLYRPREWVSFYGNYTEGFGPNNGLIFPGTLPAPSSAESWEAGTKLEFFDGRLRANADYFFLAKTNIPTADPNHIGYNLLVGEARSKGIEFDLQGEILPGWSVIAAASNEDVRVTKANPGDYSFHPGDRFTGIPRNSASLWTTYEFQDETLKGLKIGGGWRFTGAQPIFPYQALNHLNPSYGIVDLMAAYSFKLAGAKMNAQVNVTNLLNKTYYTSCDYCASSPFGWGGAYLPYGPPFAVRGSLSVELDKGATPPPGLLPVPTALLSSRFTWTGYYVGGQIGFGWGVNAGTESHATPGGLGGATSLVGDAQGVIGGGHVGYNFEINPLVIGVEGAIDGTSLRKNLLLTTPDPAGGFDANFNPFGATLTGAIRSGVQGSIRGRAGYDFGRLLVYGTGGVAFGDFTTEVQLWGLDAFGPFFASSNRSSTRVGWTAGAGVEYAVNNHWSLRSEYRYSDFGAITDSPAFPAAGLSYSVKRHLAQNQVQVGFSYKLFADPEPVAPLIVKGPALADNAGAKPAGAASAVPPPPSPPFVMNWTGYYVGAQIGYGYGDNSGSITYATPGGLAGQSNLNSNAIVVGGSNNANGDAIGVIGGAHLGYNHQLGRWVVGVEGAVDPTLLSRRVSILVPNKAADPAGAFGIGATANGAVWSPIQGSVRARAGFALDRLLFYAAGGVAFGEFGRAFQLYGIDLSLAPFYAADMRSSSRVGWTAGGGVEYAVNPHWSVRGEYRYADFGHIGDFPAATSMGAFYAADRHLDQNQVQVGLSYKFGGDAPPPLPAKY